MFGCRNCTKLFTDTSQLRDQDSSLRGRSRLQWSPIDYVSVSHYLANLTGIRFSLLSQMWTMFWVAIILSSFSILQEMVRDWIWWTRRLLYGTRFSAQNLLQCQGQSWQYTGKWLCLFHWCQRWLLVYFGLINKQRKCIISERLKGTGKEKYQPL